LTRGKTPPAETGVAWRRAILKGFISRAAAFARANPGKLNYATPGSGSVPLRYLTPIQLDAVVKSDLAYGSKVITDAKIKAD
jgi:hypothetical protein